MILDPNNPDWYSWSSPRKTVTLADAEAVIPPDERLPDHGSHKADKKKWSIKQYVMDGRGSYTWMGDQDGMFVAGEWRHVIWQIYLGKKRITTRNTIDELRHYFRYTSKRQAWDYYEERLAQKKAEGEEEKRRARRSDAEIWGDEWLDADDYDASPPLPSARALLEKAPQGFDTSVIEAALKTIEAELEKVRG